MARTKAIAQTTRTQLALAMSVAGLATAYIGLIAFNAISSLEAFATLMLVTCTPWMVIMTVGHFVRHGKYVPMDLQPLNARVKEGVYWFTGGLNYRALVAWAVATGVGLLFSSTSILTGPLTKHVSGIDLSFISAAIVGGGLYYIFLKVFPEPQRVSPQEDLALPRDVTLAE